MSSSVSLGMKRILGHLLAIFVAGTTPLIADSAATVTEAVNQVTHGSSQATDTSPAKAGTHLQDGEYLKTGVKSRAELQLANQSITRMGANTIFNYSVASNEIDLQAGTILFSKPKDGKEMTIKTASVTAAVVGSTVLAQVGINSRFVESNNTSNRGLGIVFAVIEEDKDSPTILTINGVGHELTSGQFFFFTPGMPPVIGSFDLPVFVKTCPLLTRFRPLPNQPYIAREIIRYNDDKGRGFVGLPTPPFFRIDFNGFVFTLPILAHDSAGSAVHQFFMPPEHPSVQSSSGGSQGSGSPPFNIINTGTFTDTSGG